MTKYDTEIYQVRSGNIYDDGGQLISTDQVVTLADGYYLVTQAECCNVERTWPGTTGGDFHIAGPHDSLAAARDELTGILVAIEARDSQHDWDSDYVGSQSFTLAEARQYVAELRLRAETDPKFAYPDPYDAAANQTITPLPGSDGENWYGWEFRIVRYTDSGRLVLQ